MILYGLKTCDTCRKAMKSLPEAEFRDVRLDGISPSVLKSAYAAVGAALLNTRSTTWRGLSEAERAKDPLELLAAHPSLMKRPLIEVKGRFHLGWSKQTQDALLG